MQRVKKKAKKRSISVPGFVPGVNLLGVMELTRWPLCVTDVHTHPGWQVRQSVSHRPCTLRRMIRVCSQAVHEQNPAAGEAPVHSASRENK